MANTVELGAQLSLADFEAVARRGRRVILGGEARARMTATRQAVMRVVSAGDDARAVYGVNTGFGALSETRISAADIAELQLNLIRSHATGVGPDLPVEAVRGMMLLRAQVLALGHSGVRPILADRLCDLLNAGVIPRVLSQGSVGASGDLAPLAHLALVLIGEGEAALCPQPLSTEPTYRDAREVLEEVGIEPIVLEAKEGLSLINGTQYITSLGSLALLDAERLARVADIAGAMSLEALKGSKTPFDPRLAAIRPHPGQATVARNLRELLQGSEIMESHRDCGKVQDAYSLRCMPQVHGATRDALAWVRGVLERELCSVTDNPSVFCDDADDLPAVLSGGNFHGQPLALALDLAAMAVAELGNISERRMEQLVNPTLSSGLSPFLAPSSGLHSGFMIAQVASAALVSENKVLCHPASVDSIPSSAGKEDHVSMGSISARKLGSVVSNVRASLAIEVLTAAAGLDQRAPLHAARAVGAAHACVREVVPPLHKDRPLYRDIQAVTRMIESGALEERLRQGGVDLS